MLGEETFAAAFSRMKVKLKLLGLMAIVYAANAFPQGTVNFNNRITGSVVTHVYAPLPSNSTFAQSGNGSADTPTGTQDWTSFTLIGATGTGGPFGAATTFAQLLG